MMTKMRMISMKKIKKKKKMKLIMIIKQIMTKIIEIILQVQDIIKKVMIIMGIVIIIHMDQRSSEKKREVMANILIKKDLITIINIQSIKIQNMIL